MYRIKWRSLRNQGYKKSIRNMRTRKSSLWVIKINKFNKRVRNWLKVMWLEHWIAAKYLNKVLLSTALLKTIKVFLL